MDEALTSEPQEVSLDDSMHSDSVPVEFRLEDRQEENSVSDFHKATCGCKLGVDERSCSELDAIILAQIHFLCQCQNSEPSTSESGEAHYRCTSSIANFLQWQAYMLKDIPIFTWDIQQTKC